MALTEKELEISNKSYTNKDFHAIYNELMDYSQKLSSRFSPVDSNETDPFVILLKLAAFVTDKVNYNIDKNILERFISSCTQEKSMRELTSMLGYNMHYYRSAETSVIFKYQGEAEMTNDIIIPQYSIVTNGDNIQYITKFRTLISKNTKMSSEVDVIQGKIKTLSVLDNDVIQMENLNANNIIYFPEKMVAENGVYVNVEGMSNNWKSVYNLNTEAYGSFVYKFGFDSIKNLPYLEFPTWISEIIGSGLVIKYIVTDGISGNVNAKELISVSRNMSESDVGISSDIKDEDILVLNKNAASSGDDPETLDESYEGFKKVIGTFDTLVTCRDYANKIYNLINNFGLPYVSNVQVSDRRSDINYGCDVVSMGAGGSELHSSISKDAVFCVNMADFDNKKSKPENSGKIFYIADQFKYVQKKKPMKGEDLFVELNKDEVPDEITPYDLCIYGLNPISNESYLAIKDDNGYDNSFNNLNDSKYEAIELNLQNSQTMSHNRKKLKNSDITSIRNYYKLNAVVSTTYKVNILEQQEILLNINNALIREYNPRKLDFGYGIPFENLLKTIENADIRIKAVSLQEPEQNPTIVTFDNVEHDLYEKDSDGDLVTSDQFKFIISKNLLSGKISLFLCDEDFKYSFVYSDLDKIDYIRYIKSGCAFDPLTASGDSVAELKLNKNECIQILGANLISDKTYPYGINYYLQLSSDTGDNKDTKKFIPKNSEYRLKEGEVLIFSYTNSNDQEVSERFEKGEIFCPNFNLATSKFLEESGKTATEIIDGKKYYTLGTNDEVVHKKFNSEHITNFKKCYWLTNQTNNKIEWIKENAEDENSDYYYILDSNEYFFYSDADLSSLFAYGSGTKLKIKKDAIDWTWSHNNYVNIDDINEKGLSGLSGSFIDISFSENNPLDIYQNEIISLTEGDVLGISKFNSNQSLTISDNEFIQIPKNLKISYKTSDMDISTESKEVNSWIDIPDRSSLDDSCGWYIRSILDINSGPNITQSLKNNQFVKYMVGKLDPKTGQYEVDEKELEGNWKNINKPSFKFNRLIQVGGGSKIDLQFIDLNLKYNCPSILNFNNDINDKDLTDYNNGFFGISFSNKLLEDIKYVNIPVINDSNSKSYDRYLSMYVSFPKIPSGRTAEEFNFKLETFSGDPKSASSNPECLSIINRSDYGNLETLVNHFNLKPGLNVVRISDKLLASKCSKFYFKASQNQISSPTDNDPNLSAISLLISEIKVVKGINPLLGLTEKDINKNLIIKFLKDRFPEQFSEFYITSDIDNSKHIEVTNSFKLNSAQAFYDYNNIANKWIMSKIDLANSEICIAKSSKK